MRSLWTIGLLLCACGDKAIEMTLQPPPSSVQAEFSTSCVAAVEIFVDGANYIQDGGDYVRDCIDLPANAKRDTYTDLRNRVAGQFDVGLPPSGLLGVEVFGYSGPCDATQIRDYDLIFYSSAEYTGNDVITLPMTPNLSCVQQDATIRPVDVLKLVATKDCSLAGWTEGKLGLTTLSPVPFFDQTYWWGGQSAGPIVNGVVTLHGPAKVGPDTCLAIGLYTDAWRGATCAPPTDQQVCARTEIEAPMIDLNVAAASRDAAKYSQYGAMVIGAVYGVAPAGAIAGATVTIDPEDQQLGEVVYLDMPAGTENGVGGLTAVPRTSTGPSGLFAVYTQSFVHLSITANGKTVKRVIGGANAVETAVLVKF